jgi:hypothetical protein
MPNSKEPVMLTPADYLGTDGFWAGPGRREPRPPVAAQLNELRRSFRHDDLLGPHDVEAALRAMLIGAAHLSDAVPHARLTVPDAACTARLVHGHNLLAGYAAQTLTSLGDLITHGTGPDMSHLTTSDRAEVWTRLGVASRRLQEAAEALRLAHLRIALIGNGDD